MQMSFGHSAGQQMFVDRRNGFLSDQVPTVTELAFLLCLIDSDNWYISKS